MHRYFSMRKKLKYRFIIGYQIGEPDFPGFIIFVGHALDPIVVKHQAVLACIYVINPLDCSFRFLQTEVTP